MQVIKSDAALPLPLTIAQLSSTINIINPNDDQPSVPAPAPTSASLVIALNAIQSGQCLSPTLNTPPNLQLFQSHNRHWNFGSIFNPTRWWFYSTNPCEMFHQTLSRSSLLCRTNHQRSKSPTIRRRNKQGTSSFDTIIFSGGAL